MKPALRHIVIFFAASFAALCLYAGDAHAFHLPADMRSQIDAKLESYDAVCRLCIELKTRMSSGETISKNEAEALINRFVMLNKEIREFVPEMTPAQKIRFEAIGRWFSSGVRPRLLDHHSEVPTVEIPGLHTCAECVSEPESLCREHGSREFPSRPDAFHAYVLPQIMVPDLSGGLMVGMRYFRYGGYLAFISNFRKVSPSYTCMSDGSLENGSSFWPGHGSVRSVMKVTGGFLMQSSPWLSAYAGAGYGYRILVWEDIGGSWAEVSDWSHKGLAVEAGAIFNIKSLAFSAGISTMNFRTASVTIGVGIAL